MALSRICLAFRYAVTLPAAIAFFRRLDEEDANRVVIHSFNNLALSRNFCQSCTPLPLPNSLLPLATFRLFSSPFLSLSLSLLVILRLASLPIHISPSPPHPRKTRSVMLPPPCLGRIGEYHAFVVKRKRYFTKTTHVFFVGEICCRVERHGPGMEEKNATSQKSVLRTTPE